MTTTKTWLTISSTILALLFTSATSQAGLLRLESNTLSSLRNGEDLSTETPLYEYLEASYGSNNRDLEMNANFSYFVDPRRNDTSAFNLYVLDATYRLIPRILKLKAGRSFNIESSVRTVVADQVGLELSIPGDLLRAGAFAGYERTRELDTFRSRARVAGAFLNFRSSSEEPLILTAKFQHRNYIDGSKPVEKLVSGALTKSFGGRFSPEIIANSEFNLSDYHNRLAEGGFDFHPTSRLGFRVRGTTYFIKPDEGLEQPIYSIFAQGRLYEAMIQADYKFRSDFTAGFAVAYADYDLGGGFRTDGQKFTISGRYQKAWLQVANSAYGFLSYGGEAFGDRLRLEERLSDRFSLYESGEVTHYNKITSSKRWAFSSQAGVQYSFSDPLTLTVGAEFNSNNILRYDARAIAKLTYALWAEI